LSSRWIFKPPVGIGGSKVSPIEIEQLHANMGRLVGPDPPSSELEDETHTTLNSPKREEHLKEDPSFK
jgi:hypothetical protein